MGDSIPKRLSFTNQGTLLDNFIIRKECFPGKTSRHIKYYVHPSLEGENYDAAIIHVGVNDFLNDRNSSIENLLNNIKEITNQCRAHHVTKIFISSLLVCPLLRKGLVEEINAALSKFCQAQNFYFIDNSNIQVQHLRDRLHLKVNYLNILANNYITTLNYFFTYDKKLLCQMRSEASKNLNTLLPLSEINSVFSSVKSKSDEKGIGFSDVSGHYNDDEDSVDTSIINSLSGLDIAEQNSSITNSSQNIHNILKVNKRKEF